MSNMADFNTFVEHARDFNLLSNDELEQIQRDIATGVQTEVGAISEWKERTEDAIWNFYKSVQWEAPTESLRFSVGDKVKAKFEGGWVRATILALWYREPHWPIPQFAPYQMKLEDEREDVPFILAPIDSKVFVIGENETPPKRYKEDEAMLLGYFGSESHKREWEKYGMGPLHRCCYMGGSADTLKRLLQRPFLYDIEDSNNMHFETPLIMAATYGRLHCAILLLAAGADPRNGGCPCNSNWSKTPANVAEERSLGANKWVQRSLITLLKRREAELNAIDEEKLSKQSKSSMLE